LLDLLVCTGILLGVVAVVFGLLFTRRS